MIPVSEAELGQVEEIVLVSNTPRYLVKHLRVLPQIQRLAELPPSRLIEEFEAAKAENPVICYAILVGLLAWPYSEMLAVLSAVDLSGLRWGPQIKSIVASSSTPTGAETPALSVTCPIRAFDL